MTTIGAVALVALLILCFGVVLGATWTVQAVNRRFRQLAIERRELNERRRALEENSLYCD
jgi:hypothetical protein